MPRLAALPLIVAAAVAAGVAAAAAATTTATSPPASQPAEPPPSRTFSPQPGARLEFIGFDGDRRAYILADVRQVNLWRVVIHHWPEIAATLLALVGLGIVRRAFRARRRVPGEEHCRRCDYRLRGLTSAVCPECGADLEPRSRVIGARHPRLRLTAAAALPVLVALAYLASRRDLPRSGDVSDWLDWGSIDAATWAEKQQQPWLTRHVERDLVVLVVDLDRAAIARRVCTVRSRPPHGFHGYRLSPDRRWLFCSRILQPDAPGLLGPITSELVQIDLTSGRVARVFDAGRGLSHAHVADDLEARTLLIEDRWGSGSLTAWDLAGGSRLASTDLGDRHGDIVAAPLRLGGLDLALIFSAPDGDRMRCSIWDPRSGRTVRRFNARFDPTADAFHVGRSTFYTLVGGPRGLEVERWDLETARNTDRFIIPTDAPVSEFWAVPTDRACGTRAYGGPLALIACYEPRRRLLVFNLERRALVASVPLVTSDIDADWRLSPDGRRLVTPHHATGPTRVLAVYDLPP